jgi:putative oxidoreductase
MLNVIHHLVQKIRSHVDGTGLLLLRLSVGYEFAWAGWIKLQNLTPPDWFAGLHFPLPHTLLSTQANWISAGFLESTLGLAIILGLYSRLSSLALLYVIYIAVYTVHFDLGWAGWNQIDTDEGLGFKVPLLLGLMLFTILTQGPGRFSLDHLKERPAHLGG